MKPIIHCCRPLLWPITAVVLMSGCASMAPDYQRPDAPIPAQLPDADSQSQNNLSAAQQLPWQDFIQDQRLEQVIEQALANNRDLRATIADVAAARATYRGQSADQYPALDASIEGSRVNTDGSVSSDWQATGGLSAYEIDLFGKNSSLTDAERESYYASAETARAAHISLIAETANAWLTLASDQNRLALAQQTADSAQKAMEITAKRLELGVDSRIDLVSAETTYHSARADIASYRNQVAQDKNALQLLVGSDLDNALLPTSLPTTQQLVTDIPVGLSSAVLLQRPDVLAAEHTLKSANANIGAARAAYFPSLSLTATGGVASAALSSLFSGGASTIWTLAPSLSMNIFDWGSKEADLEAAKAEQQKYLADYEYTIQSAFAEVANALARRATIQDQLDAESAYVDAAGRSHELAMKRYQAGVDSFQDTLLSERTYYSAQQELISSQLEELSNRITLYRVLGGGLAEPEPATTAAPVAEITPATATES